MTVSVTVQPETTVIEVAEIVTQATSVIEAAAVSVDTTTTGFIDASTVQGAFEQLGAQGQFTTALATKLASIESGANALPLQASHAGKFLTTDGFGTLSWAEGGGSTGNVVFNGSSIGTSDLSQIVFSQDTNFLVGLKIDGNAVATEAFTTNKVNNLIPSDTGATGSFLRTDGQGNLSWATPVGGGGTADTGNITFVNSAIGTSDASEISFTAAADFTNGLQINNQDVATQVSADAAATTIAATAAAGVIPAQATHNGKFLTTNGSALSWATVAGGGGSADTGNITFNGNTIGRNNTSDILFDAPVQMDTFTTTSTGVPTLTSGSHVNIAAVDGLKINNVDVELVPVQTSHNGKFLTTDGTNLSWATVSGTGSTGTVTFTGSTLNTSDASVIDFDAAVTFTNSTVPTINSINVATVNDVSALLPSDSGHAQKYLKADGNGNLSWSTVAGSTTGNVTFTGSVIYTSNASAIDFDAAVTFTSSTAPTINGANIATEAFANAVIPTYGVAQANQRLTVGANGALEWQAVAAGTGNANTGNLSFTNSTIATTDPKITFAAPIEFSAGYTAATIRSTDTTAAKALISASTLELTAPDGVTANGIPLPVAGGVFNSTGNTWTGSSNITYGSNPTSGVRVFNFTIPDITAAADYSVTATYNGSSEACVGVAKQNNTFSVTVTDANNTALNTGELVIMMYMFS